MSTSTSSSSWPPKSGLGTPSVPKENAVLSIGKATSINAPAKVVWQVLLDTTDWERWNTFVPHVKIDSQPDGVDSGSRVLHNRTLMTFDVIMDPAKPNKTSPTSLRVVDISTPEQPSDHVSKELLEDEESGFTADLSTIYRISWKTEGGYASKGLRSERFHEIIITGEQSCEVRTWEVFGGVLARTVKWLYSQTLTDRFDDWNRDLKQESERVFEETKS